MGAEQAGGARRGAAGAAYLQGGGALAAMAVGALSASSAAVGGALNLVYPEQPPPRHTAHSLSLPNDQMDAP